MTFATASTLLKHEHFAPAMTIMPEYGHKHNLLGYLLVLAYILFASW